jgi:hypothetical protein
MISNQKSTLLLQYSPNDQPLSPLGWIKSILNFMIKSDIVENKVINNKIMIGNLKDEKKNSFRKIYAYN